MVAREFPGLGFDPAPGDPAALSEAARLLAGVAATLDASETRLTTLATTTWSGDAGTAYRAAVGELPRDLRVAHQAHSGGAVALGDFADTLAGLQGRAAALEAQAVDLRSRRTAAHAEVDRIGGLRAPAGSAELDRLNLDYRTARSTATALDDDLDAVVAGARRLAGEARAAAETAAGRLHTATGRPPYREPHWWQRAGDGVRDWIGGHAGLLRTISAGLRWVATGAGLLSLIPGLGVVFGPVALLTAGGAVLLDATLKLATGEGSWTRIGVETALTFALAPSRVAVRLGPAVGRISASAGRVFGGGAPPGRLVTAFRTTSTPSVRPGPPVTVTQLKRTLGRARMSVRDYDIVHTPVIRDADGVLIYGRSGEKFGRPILGRGRRPLIELTDLGLSSVDEAVATTFHEIAHIRSVRMYRHPGNEGPAEEYAQRMLKIFQRRTGG